MKGSRFTGEQIIGVLREQEAEARTEEVCRRHGISSATFYKWKSKYGGLIVADTLTISGPSTVNDDYSSLANGASPAREIAALGE